MFEDSFDSAKIEDLDTIVRISTAFTQLESYFKPWHAEIMENFYLLAGQILSAADLAKLHREKRPDFEYNFFLPIITSIAGNFKNSLPKLELSGATPDDQRQVELAEGISDYVLYVANSIDYELAKVLLWAIVGRIGWINSKYSFLKDSKQGEIDISWYNGLRLMFDLNWTRRDTNDMMFMCDNGWYSPDELIHIYARNNATMADQIELRAGELIGESEFMSKDKKTRIATWFERLYNFVKDYTSTQKLGYDVASENIRFNPTGEWFDHNRRFRAIDWYEKRNTPGMELWDRTKGQLNDITSLVKSDKPGGKWYDREKIQKVRVQYVDPILTENVELKIYQVSVIPALNIKAYDELQDVQNSYFKFFPAMCYDFHPDILMTKSVIDHSKDPIKSANLRKNTMLTMLMKSTYGGWIAEKGAVKDTKDQFSRNEIFGLKEVADGALTNKAIQPIKGPEWPNALDKYAEEDIESVKYIVGAHDNSMGMQESPGESGKLFRERVAQSDVMQEWISENAQATLLMVGINNFSLVERYYTEERVIPILKDESDPQWVVLNQKALDGIIHNDVSKMRINVRISSIPYGRQAKDMIFQRRLALDQFIMTIDKEYVDLESLIESAPDIAGKRKMLERIKSVLKQRQMQLQQQDAAQNAAQNVAMQQHKMQMNSEGADLQKKNIENRSKMNDLAVKQMIKQHLGI
jgi:hypothetical protein